MSRTLGRVAIVAGVAGVTAWVVAVVVTVYRDATPPVSWDFGWLA